MMEDREIIELYNARSETAIEKTDQKYGRYCRSIAFHILQSNEDTEECVNDTYLRVWNVIPPKWPECLRMFLGKITRNISFDVFRRRHTDKRMGDQVPLALEELSECIPARVSTEESVDEVLLVAVLDRFLDSLPEREKWLFSRRYWNTDSIKELADAMGLTENNVKVLLYRTRRKLRRELEKEGFEDAI